jgi:RNA polymerase sigma factor (sigma-70 family)
MKHGLHKTLHQLRRSLSPDSISDAQLLHSFITERDDAAFAALVRRHGPMVLGVCQRILGNPHDSDDVFQATFLVLVQKARFVLKRQALASWLYRVAYRSALEVQIRNRRRHNRERRVALRHAETTPPEPQDWRPVLDRELNRLPEKYRAPMVLCDIEGRSRREAARLLRLAEGTLSSRLATARRMLARRLSRQGVTLSGGALAVSLAEASACVPPTLVGLTTQAALLVATGKTAAISTSISLVMKGVAQAMFLAKLKATLATVMALVLGAGALVYCASGQTGAGGKPAVARPKPDDQDQALRNEDESVKLALRIMMADGARREIKSLQNRIKELESEVATLREFLAQQLNPLPEQQKPENKGRPKNEPETIEAVMKRLGALSAKLAQSKKSDAELVDALFDAALNRLPAAEERANMLNHFQGGKDRFETGRDILWALVNSREFLKRNNLDRDVAGSLRLLNKLSAGWDQMPEADRTGGKATPDKGSAKPNEFEALRRENELLRKNLRKALERIRMLENDVTAVREFLADSLAKPAKGKSRE